MKSTCFKFLSALVVITICCSAIRPEVNNNDLHNEAIRIAVHDFLSNCSLRKKDSVFSVNIYIDDADILGLSISPQYEDKFYPASKDTIGSETIKFPSHYIERNNKLFFWGDSVHILSEEIVKILSKYNQIDSTFVNEEKAYPDFYVDEKLKGAHYYFCKNDLKRFKRVVTNIGMGWYAPPKLKCK